jgi:Cu/Ag efflux protein CusF
MKAHVRTLAALLVAAAFCLPQFSTQLNAQMRGLQDRGIQGDVTAVSGNTITVKTTEGEVYTVSTGPNTRFRKQRDQIAISDLHPGDMIAAMGDKDAKAHTVGAMYVMVMDKARYEQMQAEFGKTWTAGTVQSISGTNITIKRTDGVTQTVSVDENTTFRRRRDDITLADIKVGDEINARGALHNGAFVATQVSEGRGGMGMGMGRQRSGSQNTNDSGTNK